LFDESEGEDHNSDQDEEKGYHEEAKYKKDHGNKKSPIQTKDYSDELQMDKSLIVDNKYRYGF
jgi:hypothetical protein